jgi:ferrochelatase
MSNAKSYPADSLDPHAPTGLMLVGMGGPDDPEAVKPFLRNLFSDPAVLPLPGPISRVVGAMIVRGRAAEVRRRYESLGHGGGSPQLSWTLRQCERLEELMRGRGLTVRAKPAMRYWHPFPGETAASLISQGARQFLLLPAFPQYSEAASGSALAAAVTAVRAAAGDAPVHVVRDWHLLPGYVEALASMAEPVLKGWAARGFAPRECALLPVAHSLPERFIKSGDPYLRQTRATVEAVRSHLAIALAGQSAWWDLLPGGGSPLLAFQSKVGPVKWIGPEASGEVARLAARGCRRLLVLPVSFTCEHIETLYELDVDLAAKARRAGVQEFLRAGALNLNSRWLVSLADYLAARAYAANGRTEARSSRRECYARA